ncbi:GNAT family N-acetyltransferase [Nocardia brasiliensis]|uniref:GNAT family N-acetyltransferase n=1 Tax=Nocardia brasiliensis TaxID=37326 RepID=UPI002458B45B|nr:GNAT family N-acetyltransferase [Nocardia brasiliensis]
MGAVAGSSGTASPESTGAVGAVACSSGTVSPNRAGGAGSEASSSGTVSPNPDGRAGAVAGSSRTTSPDSEGGTRAVATSVHAEQVGAFVGWVALQPPADGGCREVELGYRFLASVWGRGYATEVGRALVHKGFSEFGVRRVWAQTMAVNLGSRRVLEKVGLRYVRTFHLDFEDPLPGTEQGEVEYEVGRDEWLAGAENRLPGLEA